MSFKMLFIDIETSPNIAHVWGLFQQNVSIKQLTDASYTMCFACRWRGQKKVHFDSVHKSKPKDMIRRAWEFLDEADMVVHYNGSRFDVPTLNKEFLHHGFPPPSPYKQVDLLRTARKEFRFPSNKLDYLVQALGIGAKVKHIGHELWVQCMAGDDKAWREMEKYNRRDVTLLEELYDRILPWIQNHPNLALYQTADVPICTNCGNDDLESRGLAYTKTLTYRRFRCKRCGKWMRSRKNNTPPEKKENVLVEAK